MGGHIYRYWTKYQTDTKTTLEDLQKREFVAGRYNPVMPFIEFPITDDSPSPGANHESIRTYALAP